MKFDPEQDPDTAEFLAELLATGEYVEAFVSCPDCHGGFTAVVKRVLLDGVSSTCMFCDSAQVTTTAFDPLDAPQLS